MGMVITETKKAGTAIHKVKKGENVWSIANHYASSPVELKRLNPGVDLNRLKSGQSLVVPATGAGVTSAATSGAGAIASVVKKKKKKKNKGGFFKKAFKAAGKVAKASGVSSGAKFLMKNPLTKAGLNLVPGGNMVNAVIEANMKGDKKKAKEMMESPEYQQAEEQIEAKILAMGKRYGIQSDDLDTVLQGLAEAKQSGKLVKGGEDDQILTGYLAMQVNEEEVSPSGGGTGGLLAAGGGIAALWLLL